MVNLGSPKESKEHLRISGNVVITNIQISGISVTGDVSGQSLYVFTSGNTLDITSGNWCSYLRRNRNRKRRCSGIRAVQISGTVSVVSGTGVRVSGECVYAYITGGRNHC